MNSFGSPISGNEFTNRIAAYVVVVEMDAVATVRPKERCFLPGGGVHIRESPEHAVRREVSEELGRELRSVRPLAEAIQHFYSADDDRHYRMHAHFFVAEFGEIVNSVLENELIWLSVDTVEAECFHACHAWAVRLAATAGDREKTIGQIG